MTTHLKPGPQHKPSVFADLAALLCRGGLVVETLAGPGSVSVRSTIQLDGDMTVCVARSTIGEASVLVSHMAAVETRIQSAARLVKRTVWAAHGIIGLTVSIAWFHSLYDSPMLDDRLTNVAVWIGLSTTSVAIVECVLQTSIARRFLLSLAINGLSSFAAK